MTLPLEPEVAPVWGESILASPDLVRPSDGFIQSGWPESSIPPSRGFFNWVLKFASNAATHLMVWGIPNWQADREYVAGSLQRDQSGAIYVCVGTATLGVAPYADLANWFMVTDRFGLPTGRAVRWTENWPASDPGIDSLGGYLISGTGGWTRVTGLTTNGWRVKVLDTNVADGSLKVGFIAAPLLALGLAIKLGTAVGDYSFMSKDPETAFAANNRAAIEFDVWPGATAVAESELVLGYANTAASTAGFFGAVFFTDGGSNWKIRTGDGSAVTTVTTDAFVAGAAWQRMRIEWTGTGFKFYVGGVLRGTITTTLPTDSPGEFFGAKKLSGVAQLLSFVSPVQAGFTY